MILALYIAGFTLAAGLLGYALLAAVGILRRG